MSNPTNTEWLSEILQNITGLSDYTTNPDGEFVPINWENSPVLEQAKQAILDHIEANYELKKEGEK